MADIGLPGLDGYAVVRELRRRARGAPGGDTPFLAIALTAFGRAEDRDAALAAGFDLHMSKPLRPLQLIANIRRLRTSDS